jgi:hypothetical protein
MFKNVQLLSHLHSKFAKSAILTPIFYIFNTNRVSKSAEFYTEFKFVDADFAQEKVIEKICEF